MKNWISKTNLVWCASFQDFSLPSLVCCTLGWWRHQCTNHHLDFWENIDIFHLYEILWCWQQQRNDFSLQTSRLDSCIQPLEWKQRNCYFQILFTYFHCKKREGFESFTVESLHYECLYRWSPEKRPQDLSLHLGVGAHKTRPQRQRFALNEARPWARHKVRA